MNILFVCTGNTCRSPMAEFMMKKLLVDKNRADVQVVSAGLAPALGLPFPEEARKSLGKENVSEISHQAKPAEGSLLKHAGLILAMEEHHVVRLIELFPEEKSKIHLLKEFAGISENGPGVADPIGQSQDFYDRTLKEIKLALIRILDKI